MGASPTTLERASRVVQLVYQPIVELESGRVRAFEALARFQTARRRPPDEWFARAARAGLGVALECHAIAKALSALEFLPGPILLSVNASPQTACSSDLLCLLSTVDARRVIIELTEHARVADYEVLARQLRRLRALGARIGVDDTGAGISRLPHVARIKPDVIKLDRSLCVEASRGGPLAAHARGVVAYAEAVDVPIIAEGIETAQHLAAIRRLGVTLGQGRYLGGPHSLRYWSTRFGLPVPPLKVA